MSGYSARVQCSCGHMLTGPGGDCTNPDCPCNPDATDPLEGAASVRWDAGAMVPTLTFAVDAQRLHRARLVDGYLKEN